MHSLRFSKPVIQARGSKAFASYEASLNMTSFHRLSRAREAVHLIEEDSVLKSDPSGWGSNPRATAYEWCEPRQGASP